MTSELPTTTSDWIALLERETELLEGLARATVAARNASLRDSRDPFLALLDEQTNLCRRLEESRRRRRQGLVRAGRPPGDLPELVRETDDPELQQRARNALDRWFEAARTTQHENDLNREFYTVALSTVEEAVSIITGARTRGYDPRGRGVRAQGRAFVTTSI